MNKNISKYAKIAGIGSYLPEKVLDNYELEKMVDTTHEWIMTRTGISERRIASSDETISQMGLTAAEIALNHANISAEDLDLILLSTSTPETFFPSAACQIQTALGAKKVMSFDLSAACSGFLYGMNIAEQYIKAGSAKNVLIVSAETMSKIVDWNDRATCVLFGDGAAAVVLQASDEPGIIASELHSDGKYKDILFMNTPISGKGDQHFQMSGAEVFKNAVNNMIKTPQNLLQSQNMTIDDIDWLVPHQANIRIVDLVIKKLRCPREKVIYKVSEHANTSSASVPLALDYGIKSGKIKPGQTVLLDAFGAGLTWGAVLLKV